MNTIDWRLVVAVAALLAGSTGLAARDHPAGYTNATTSTDTVFVAPPTGERETDRASILAALEQVRPGGTVQFAEGTYLIGEIIPVPVSRIKLLGHAEGTTLRGCHPEEWASVQNPRASCNTLELLGSHQTVRDLTFEHMSLGLALGPATRRLAGLTTGDEETLIDSITGGHLIDGNTFRESSNGIRGDGTWSESILIRGNRFINTYHAVSLAGSHVHLLDNDISVPQPERVPSAGHPGLAVQVAGTNEHFPGGPFDCRHNVIAGNRIEGHPQGSLYVYALGGHCRHNVIRDNTIIVPTTARFSGDPLEEAGVPLLLYVAPVGHRSVPDPEDRGSIEENVIEGNRVVGAEGLGIAIYGASRNRIVNNTIAGITRQDRNLLEIEGIPEEQWRVANGSGIWLSRGSDENEIAGNVFDEIASHAVVLEGDRNRVEVSGASDAVRDLGSGNRIAGPVRSDGPAQAGSRMVDLDGHAVHVYTAGWEHIQRGLPVVVFEAGAIQAWGRLPARLAEEAAVVAYDRAGIGRSEWDEQDPTPEHVVSRLRRLLEVLGAPPPYLLVGQSIGGPLVLSFARRYPDAVAGLVLVDPTPPMAEWLASFDDIGVGRAGHEEFLEMFGRLSAMLPPGARAEMEHLLSNMGDFAGLDASRPGLPVPIPVTVLLAGAGYEIPPELPTTFDLDRQHAALLRRQVALYTAWTRTLPDATITVANNSRHCIQCWDPDLVLAAIRRVLFPDIRVQLRQTMATGGVSAVGEQFQLMKSSYPADRFQEDLLDRLGYELLSKGNVAESIVIFELNVREYPGAPKPHDSLGDAYRAAGRIEAARTSYEQAVRLAEAADDPRLPLFRGKLERVELLRDSGGEVESPREGTSHDP